MKDTSLAKLGGTCAILLGVLSVLLGITYLLLPPEQRLGVPGAQLLPSFAQNPTPLTLQLWELALVGILGLAVVPAISQMVRSLNEGWVRWTSNLAFVGFAVAAVSNFVTISKLPGIAAAYVAGDTSTKAAILPFWRTTLDQQGFWQYGAIGLWVLVISLVGLRSDTIPKPLTYLGLAFGVLHWLVPAALLLKIPSLVLIVSVIGGIAAPIWYIWIGLVRRRTT